MITVTVENPDGTQQTVIVQPSAYPKLKAACAAKGLKIISQEGAEDEVEMAMMLEEIAGMMPALRKLVATVTL